MSRIAKRGPVPAKMYRHFAVVTVLITLCLAFLADGENKQYLERQAAAKSGHKPRVERTKIAAGVNNGITVREKKERKASFGPDIGMPNDNVWVAAEEYYVDANGVYRKKKKKKQSIFFLRDPKKEGEVEAPPPGLESEWLEAIETERAQKDSPKWDDKSMKAMLRSSARRSGSDNEYEGDFD